MANKEQALSYMRRSGGNWNHIYVDEYGPGINQDMWDVMVSEGWFAYTGGSWRIGGFETWELTEKGKRALEND